MTPETRIGLLVGLAFIVTFGLILSELMSSKMPTAATAAFEESKSPGGAAPLQGPSGGHDGGRASPRSGGALPLAAVGLREGGGQQARPPSPGQSATAAKITHKVQPGDTLIKIARRYYGPAHGEEYLRIYQANRQVISDESSLQIGRELVIPPLKSGPSTQGPAPSERPGPAGRGEPRETDAVRSAGRPSAGAPGLTGRARTHVVQQGETLSAIAAKYLGDSGEANVTKIFSANRDKLSGPDDLAIGVVLRIPG